MSGRRIPSLNWLRVFEAAARAGSFAGAARILNMTPPAVSKQVKALETHLNQQLFTRGPHSIALTRAGSAFIPIVRTSLQSIDSAAISVFGERHSETVRVHAPALFATSWLAERYWDFEERHPKVHLQLLGDPVRDLAAAGDDLLITYGTAPGGWGDHDRLFGETLYPVAALSVAATVRVPSDLFAHRLLEVGADRPGWMRFLAAHAGGSADHARFRFTDSTPIALAIAASGGGIALARAPASDFLVRSFGLVRCLPGLDAASAHAYFLACPSRDNLPRAAASFRRWLLGQPDVIAAATPPVPDAAPQ